MGVTAVGAAGLAARASTTGEWLVIWLVEAVLAAAVAGAAMVRKARAAGQTLSTGPARKFALGFLPPVAAGAVLTAALADAGVVERLPGVWLLLYGAAVVTGGAHSVRVVPILGVCLMVTGVLALLSPAAWGDAWMAAGFGGLQILFGAIIARRHGG